MRHAGSHVDALRARVGVAAGLAIEDRPSGAPGLRLGKYRQRVTGPPSIARTPSRLPTTRSRQTASSGAPCRRSAMTSQASAYVGRMPQPFSDEALALSSQQHERSALRRGVGPLAAWDGTRWHFDDTLQAFDLCAPRLPRRGSKVQQFESRQGSRERGDRGGSGAARAGRSPAGRHDRPVGRRPVAAQHAGRRGRSAHRQDPAGAPGRLLHQNHGGRAWRRLPECGKAFLRPRDREGRRADRVPATRCCGYALTGITREHALFFLWHGRKWQDRAS